ncbi:hypothetical protein BDV35DRAFT_307727 [Aspergillus flavus]|uniref:Uncharacterized protein n=1 Tax=Aspergillus flavus TaxID=5059 RepID=A0A5N6GRR7_ASPFL|nr:hypothetical protein BDV35DRAFT_307727 [Aspergillus flavus]
MQSVFSIFYFHSFLFFFLNPYCPFPTFFYKSDRVMAQVSLMGKEKRKEKKRIERERERTVARVVNNPAPYSISIYKSTSSSHCTGPLKQSPSLHINRKQTSGCNSAGA